MRFFAILTMLIAWLFYGAMPALASCPICDSEMAMPAASTVSMTDMHGMAGHGDMAQYREKKPENPCAGGMAHVPSCAACLAVTPALAAADSRQHVFSYPVPAPVQRLAGARPEPMSPPPRFA